MTEGMDGVSITFHDLANILGIGLALLGFGFSAWALLLKRTLAVIDKLDSTLDSITNRVTTLEEQFRSLDRRIGDFRHNELR
jgi:hypothetical protein